MSAAKRNELATLFLRAAEFMDNPKIAFGCCYAIEKVQLLDEGYGTPAHDAFEDAFPWKSDWDALAPWQDWGEDGTVLDDYPEDARQARVLALLFCAEMARLGEIG